MQTITETVKEKYAAAALRVAAGTGNSCCGGAPPIGWFDPITSNLYDNLQRGGLPEAAVRA